MELAAQRAKLAAERAMSGSIFYEGGCACGAVRYRATRPTLVGWCHCTTCQKLSGSPGMVWGSVMRTDFEFTVGESDLGRVQLTRHAIRIFCKRCGSPLTVAYSFQPQSIDLTVGSLDQPNLVQPDHHIFWRSAPAWLHIEDDLPRYDRFRPGTEGLTGTELPP
jgi:hypothetical protein